MNTNTLLLVILLVLVVGGGVWWYTTYGPGMEGSGDVQINIGGQE